MVLLVSCIFQVPLCICPLGVVSLFSPATQPPSISFSSLLLPLNACRCWSLFLPRVLPSDPPEIDLVKGVVSTSFWSDLLPFGPISTIWGRGHCPFQARAALQPARLVFLHPEADVGSSRLSAFQLGFQCGDFGLPGKKVKDDEFQGETGLWGHKGSVYRWISLPHAPTPYLSLYSFLADGVIGRLGGRE